MKYIEVTFTMDDTGMFRDLLVDALGNEGPYESFVETKEGLKAYVPVNLFDEAWLRQQLQDLRDQFSTFNFQFRKCPTEIGMRSGKKGIRRCWWNMTGAASGYGRPSIPTEMT